MRTIVMLLTVAMLGVLAGAAPGSAEITYPWCAQYGGTDGGGNNCGFVTVEQCRATVSGTGGFCYVNPMHRPAAPLADGARRLRR